MAEYIAKKKWSRKKKLAVFIPLSVLGAALIAAIIVGGIIVYDVFFRVNPVTPLGSTEYATVCYERPDDGTLPTDHTAIENIGYMNWTLKQQDHWYSEMHGNIPSVGQSIETYKQYSDGVLISADISKSSFVNTANQFCVADGLVLWRPSAGGAGTYNGLNTPWSDKKPEDATISDYIRDRGLPPSEFSVYVINENTVLNPGDIQVVDNGNGTYSQTLHLNTTQDSDENSAVYYYRQQMKVTGNLTDWPTYSDITVTYTFDSDWQVLKVNVHESYTAKKGKMITMTMSSDSETNFVYDNEELCHNSAYEDYFKEHIANFNPSEDKPPEPTVTVTATDCIISAFGPVINNTGTLSAKLGLKDLASGKVTQTSGLITVRADMAESGSVGIGIFRADLGAIKAQLIAENGTDYLYIQLGEGFKAKINLADFSVPDGNKTKSAGNPLDEIASAVFGGEFTVAEDGRSAVLKSTLDFGQLLGGLFAKDGEGKNTDFGALLGGENGLKAVLTFNFDLDENKAASLASLSAGIENALGTAVDAQVVFTNDSVDALTGAEKSAYSPLNLTELAKIVSAKNLKADVALSIAGLDLEGQLGLSFGEGVALKGDLELSADGKEEAAKTVSLESDGNNIYLGVASKGQKPVLFTGDLEKLTNTSSAGLLVKITKYIRTNGLISLINTIFGGETAILKTQGNSIVIDGNALVHMIWPESKTKIGELRLSFSDKTTLSAAGIGLTAGLTAGGNVVCDSSAYKGAMDILPVVDSIKNIVTYKKFSIAGDIAATLGGNVIQLDSAALSADIAGDAYDLDAQFGLGTYSQKLALRYAADKAKFFFGDLGVLLDKAEYTSFKDAALGFYNAVSSISNGKLPPVSELLQGELGGLFDLFKSGQSDYGDFVNKLGICAGENGEIKVTFGDVTAFITGVGADSSLEFGLTYARGNISLTLEGGKLSAYKQLGNADFGGTYFASDDIISLLNSATKIINGNGVTLSGQINIPVLNNTDVSLSIVSLSMGWENGFELDLDARLSVAGSLHDIYANYRGGALTLLYGKSTAVRLDSSALQGGETEAGASLSGAITDLYNRIADVVNKIAKKVPAEGETAPDVMQKIKSLEELSALLGVTNETTSTFKELINLFKDFSVTKLVDMLGKLEIGPGPSSEADSGIISLNFGGIGLEAYRAKADGTVGINLSLGTRTVELKEVAITKPAFSACGVEVAEENVMSADDLCNALVYVGSAVELAAQEQFKIELSGSITTTEAAYETQGFVKYNLDGTFEYVQGSEYPVHLEISGDENGKKYNFWVSPDMYAHIAVNMIATLPEEDSVLFDIYIMDGNPEVAGGKTTNGALTGDGNLDVFMSIGRIANNYTDADGKEITATPAKIYAPVEEILTVASAAVSMLDINSVKAGGAGVDPELAGAVNGVISKLGGLIEDMLVNKYLPDSKDRFASLGSSLIERLLGGSVSDKLGNLLAGLGGGKATKAADQPAVELTPDRERLGVNLGSITTDKSGSLTVKVNATTAKVTKDGMHRLTGLFIDKVQTKQGQNVTVDGDVTATEKYTETLADFNVGITYDKAEKAAALEGYYDLRGIDTLLESIVNSATHEVADGEGGKTYTINDQYFIDGNITLSVSNLLELGVNIDGLLVQLDGNNNIVLDAKFSYEGVRELVTLVLGDSEVYLSVKNGMVYIKRVQTTDFNGGFFHTSKQSITPIITYRAMPLDTFMADIMNQMFFMLNLNTDLINSIMGLVGSGGGEEQPSATPRQDYGTQLSEYLQSFSATQNAADGTASWQIALNGTGINRLAGMDGLIGDGLKLTFGAQKPQNGGGYLINSLGIDGKLLKVFNVNGSLGWQNAGNVYTDGSEAAKDQIVSSSPSADMEKWIGVSGAYTFEDIKSKIMWDDLATVIDSGSQAQQPEFVTDTPSYLEVGFSDTADFANCTSNVRLAELGYYVQNEPNSAEKTLLSEQTIFYRNTDGKICTYGAEEKPDVTSYAKEHYDLVWGETEKSGAKWSVVAEYKPVGYSVTFTSEHEIPGWEDNGDNFSHTYTHTYGDILDFDFGYEIRTGETWYRIDHITIDGVDYYDAQSVEIAKDTQITVVWAEIPHTTVTVFSEKLIEGFTQTEGGYTKDFEVETGVEVDMFAMLGDVPAVDGYVFTGLQFEGGSSANIINISAPVKITAVWEVPTINVRFFSAVQAEGFEQDADYAGGDYDVVYTSDQSYNGDYTLSYTPTQSDKMFVGWFYKGAEGWIKVNDLLNDIPGSEKFTQTVELHAVWASTTVGGSGTYKSSWVLFSTIYTYTLSDAYMELTFYGAESIISSFTTTASFEFSAADKNVSKSVDDGITGSGKFTVTEIKTDSTKTLVSSGRVTVTYTIKFNGVEVYDGTAVADVTLEKSTS